MLESLFGSLCKIGTLLKFSWNKSNSQKALTKNGHAVTSSGDHSPVHIGDTHNHHYQSKHDPLRKTIAAVSAEAKYNETPGIGDQKCPFRLDAHHKLLIADYDSPKELIKLVSTITCLGGLCNGGRIGGEVRPGVVKEKSKELQIALTKFTESQSS